MKILSDTDLAPHHTFGISAQAAAIVEAESMADLLAIWHADDYKNQIKLYIGQGSNLLFTQDYRGVVILNRLKGINVSEDTDNWYLEVQAGEDWHQFVTWCVEHGYNGLENLALIPGCVGSSPIQNIGAYGVEIKDVCHYVDLLDLDSQQVTRLSNEDCQFGYRESRFKQDKQGNKVIVQVGFKLAKQWQPTLNYAGLNHFDNQVVTAKEVFNAVCQVRQSKLPDPKQIGNAGSFFKNPVITQAQSDTLLIHYPTMPHHFVTGGVKVAAGWLIDQAGLKGKQIGGAQVHPKQALVLTNTGTATAQDIIDLASFVVEQVKTKFSIELEHEVRFMAADRETSLSELLAKK
ncbi:UDP-N-acetylmuramate dehydrogenase [Vibrio sp. SS-MA-C1-2]|uniref:UDP-N-acetylmuramate dehydrogenase n=1 Tax=Vibrio sp. SS-MA-C1-2 TaxID=2908646 RepID=UPI001F391007|nr:UDP-N-acetylmuramate dehydrogenase [Vibrio sp. SS-MA-C1-2]UJF19193.1 UDP-N-acetylmuramate dehydrogenase [Vibrio sp. SS-MA-C1-2]